MDHEITLNERQRTFRAAGLAFFVDALGLLFARVLVNIISRALPDMDPVSKDVLITVIFDVLVQIIISFTLIFFLYKFYLKKSSKDVFRMSNVRPTDKRIYGLSFLLGICAFVITIYVSYFTQVVLIMLGFDPTSTTYMPEKFNFWHLLLMLFVTAVLPAICEEFVNRGILITALRGTFSKTATVVLGGIAFGLFHQYVSQVVYTAFMGMLLTYLVLTTRSIIPAVIVHFTNNAIAVATDFIGEYAMIDPVSALLQLVISTPALLFFILGAMIAIAYVIIRQIKKCYSDYYAKNYGEFVKTGDEKHLNKIDAPWLMGDVRYKPVLKDWTFYIGGLIVTVVYTLFSFYWGLF